MTLNESIKRYTDNAEYERTHGNLQGRLDFKQLAEWLRELKAYRNVRRILSQNRIATDRYGEVVLWDDIKRVLTEVNTDD